MSLIGKSVIVTGGGSGIGKAAALLLGEAGCDVTIADLNEDGGKDAVATIAAQGKGRAQFISTDVSREDQVRAMIAAAVSSYGKLDGAINAAGVAQAGVPLHEVSIEQFDRCVGINLRGMFLCVKYQIEAMLESGGSIVAISSTAAYNGVPNSSEYCAAKSGVNGLVRGGSVDYASRGIRINGIMPGGTWTPMVEASINKDPALNAIVDMFPMKRFARPEEIAAAAVWLVSDEASYTTGACIPIDGALTIA
ncbi:MAG: SDR family NAD(P)-dependent oxidoreductase [Sphingobium sp.]